MVTLLLAGAVWLLMPFWQLSAQFGERTVRQPSRLYGRPLELVVGRWTGSAPLVDELRQLGYRDSKAGRPAVGELVLQGRLLTVHLRPFATPRGRSSGGLLEIAFTGRRISSLRWRGAAVDRFQLEPPLLATFYGPGRQERRPVALEQVPEDLIRAVLAAEDDSFFRHAGLSVKGTLRAAWVNLKQGGLKQGGSTLTQQLVKNLFLTHERSLGRKLREAMLALLIDLRYDKREILEAYLNEIYWGRSGSVELIGVGAAAGAWFGKRPAELDLCEAALLAGMIRSPGRYGPTVHPEAARGRRDWVLDRMVELGWLDPKRATQVRGEPLCVSPRRLESRGSSYFADAMAAEARRRFEVDELETRGWELLSSLDRREQLVAEAIVSEGLAEIETTWEKAGKSSGSLQGALVSIDPANGEIRAWVGGRDYRTSQFDRVSQARRQAGSAFKPVIYAAAFADGVVAPSSLLEDEPLTVAQAGREWSPRNSDASYRGRVTVRQAVEDSLNVPTARLALEVGLDRIVGMARALGVRSRLQPVPALALGAFEVSPLELATVYATLAAGGTRREPHGLRGVVSARGEPVAAAPLPQAEQALSPQAAYLLVSVLQGVLIRGTGSSARIHGITDPLAGKTGTTNDRRDSWFAGFSPDRVTLVWVGYDDNSPTRLSGARAALPLWARFTHRVRPTDGYRAFVPPPGISTAVIDPESGELAVESCPRVLTEVFLEGRVPNALCRLHGERYRDESWREGRADRPGGRRPWRWLRRLFGGGKGKKDRPEVDSDRPPPR